MSVLYIQIRRNQITVRDLESKREVSGDAAFSNQRLLIANFFVAEKVLVVAGATLMKYRQFHIHAQSVVLSDSAVLAMFKQK